MNCKSHPSFPFYIFSIFRGGGGRGGRGGGRDGGRGRGRGGGRGGGRCIILFVCDMFIFLGLIAIFCSVSNTRLSFTILLSQNKHRGGGRGGRGGGMKGGSKVVIEPHRHEGVFIARGKEDALVTLNSTPGVAVYGEKRISVESPPGPDGNAVKVEYRVWNPFRSKSEFVFLFV